MTGRSGWVPPWVAEVAAAAAGSLQDGTPPEEVAARAATDARSRGATVRCVGLAVLVDGFCVDVAADGVTVDGTPLPG